MAHLAGTHFSDFLKLTFYLFQNVENLIFTATIFSENWQIANFAKFSTRKQKYP